MNRRFLLNQKIKYLSIVIILLVIANIGILSAMPKDKSTEKQNTINFKVTVVDSAQTRL